MDMWEINENARVAHENPERTKMCVAAMLYACQQQELELIKQYTALKQHLCDLVGPDKADNALCTMLCNIIADSENRAASFGKAAALCSGHDAPKPIQYDKAVKSND